MNRLSPTFILHHEHSWVQALPISANLCVCTDCKIKSPMRELSKAKPCTEKLGLYGIDHGHAGRILNHFGECLGFITYPGPKEVRCHE